MRIPEEEVEIIFSRSSGPGGQNVNKVSSRVQLRWNIGHSKAFYIPDKERIRSSLKNQVTTGDEIVVTAAQERSQAQNRELALKRLNNMVQQALKVPKKRFPTRPTLTSKLKRLAKKRKVSMLKQGRKFFDD